LNIYLPENDLHTQLLVFFERRNAFHPKPTALQQLNQDFYSKEGLAGLEAANFKNVSAASDNTVFLFHMKEKSKVGESSMGMILYCSDFLVSNSAPIPK
jgi:hypothetical protein